MRERPTTPWALPMCSPDLSRNRSLSPSEGLRERRRPPARPGSSVRPPAAAEAGETETFAERHAQLGDHHWRRKRWIAVAREAANLRAALDTLSRYARRGASSVRRPVAFWLRRIDLTEARRLDEALAGAPERTTLRADALLGRGRDRLPQWRLSPAGRPRRGELRVASAIGDAAPSAGHSSPWGSSAWHGRGRWRDALARAGAGPDATGGLRTRGAICVSHSESPLDPGRSRRCRGAAVRAPSSSARLPLARADISPS